MTKEDFEFKEEDFDYELDTAIDKNHLDKELQFQPSLFMKYAKLQKKAKKVFDLQWEKVKTIRSKIIKEIKEENPKATAQLVEAEYRTNEEYIEEKKAAIEAEYSYNILDAATLSLHQRKASLQDLVKLYLNEYWADGVSGNIDGETKTTYDKHQKTEARNIIKKARRKKR